MKNYILVLFVLFLTSCYQFVTIKRVFDLSDLYKYPTEKPTDVAKKSFVKIQVEVKSNLGCTSDLENSDCATIDIGNSSGSGSVIKTGFTGTWVLTAAHVCSPEQFKPELQTFALFSKLEKEIFAINYYGIIGKFDVEKIDIEQDICILKTKDFWSFVPVLDISKSEPRSGDNVRLFGAPHGIFWPGTVLFFDGHYIGLDDEQAAVYTVPIVGGVSGGPVINEKGQIIGIIHSGLSNMEHIGFGTNWHMVKGFTEYLF